ncbi:uncharacterized protein LOC141628076 [Silene latifolia]|uniref:uncharacterized protein LOC141628076 n=1 Tax=Silene latifolia TaxID=37657 RepID=UPI003D774029
MATTSRLFGFPTEFTSGVLAYVTSSHFSLNINGVTEGFFPGRRDLRQGDPLSPYLFALYYLLVFTGDDLPSIKAVSNCPALFATYSGLRVNPMKTNLNFGGVSSQIKALILFTTRCAEGDFPVRYLGIPLFSARLTQKHFQPMLDKIKSKIPH